MDPLRRSGKTSIVRGICGKPLHLTPDGSQPHITIALCDLPRMVADIVTVLIEDVPNVDIVARAARLADCLSADEPPADLLICSVREIELVPAWTAALRRRAVPAVVNLCADSVTGALYAVYPVRRQLEELTARSLLSAVYDHTRAANRAIFALHRCDQ